MSVLILRRSRLVISRILRLIMVQCFAAECNHQSERDSWRFFRFPQAKNAAKLALWIRMCSKYFHFLLVIQEASCTPEVHHHSKRVVWMRDGAGASQSRHSFRDVNDVDLRLVRAGFLYRRKDKEPNSSSRLCSCHFQDGSKENGPTVFPRNLKRVFHFPDPEPKRQR